MKENKNAEEAAESEVEQISLPMHAILLLFLVSTAVLWMTFPNGLTKLFFTAVVAISSALLMILSFADFKELKRDRLNFVPFIIGLMLLIVLLMFPDTLLTALFTVYMILAVLLSSRAVKLQTVILLALAVTAIMFRIYPALPGSGPMAGHLISMDDPYYHYKYTQDLYNNGDIATTDYRIYPPDGKPSPHLFPYYYNTYLALITGLPLHDIMLVYAVLISAFGAVLMYFLLKELTHDWKSGAIAGFLFATIPTLLTKSAAGGTEEDTMGMVLGILSMYLLVKAMRAEGSGIFKFGLVSGISFFLTAITWGGGQFLFVAPFLAIAVYFYISSIFRQENWGATKAVFMTGVVMAVLYSIYSKSFTSALTYNVAFAAAFFVGLWSEALRERLQQDALAKALLPLGLIGLVISIYGIFWESSPSNIVPEILVGAALLLLVMVVTSIMSLLKGQSAKSKQKGDSLLANLESTIKSKLPLICTVLLIVGIFGGAFIGLDKVAGIPESIYARFAGISNNNFLVDKTISEQAAFASPDWGVRFRQGFTSYGLGFALTILMSFGALALLIYYLVTRREEFPRDLLLAYLFGFMFFLFTMRFVWIESRLAFSQSLGFLMLGALVGLMMPKNFKELGSIKVITFAVLIPVLLLVTFIPYNVSGIESSWDSSIRSAGVESEWFLGVKWLDENTLPGSFSGDTYTNGDTVFTWWDYGHFITALSRDTVATDPLQASEDYIMRTARFFYNKTTEDEAIKWLMEQPFNTKDANGDYKIKYIILDYSLIGKASALAFLGTNYYQYPNGYTAVNGVCQAGEVCQNVENGVMADADGKCSQGVVCTRDKMISAIEEKKCCEEKPTQCCDTSFDWHVIDQKGGSARILRSPGTPVYGQYMLQTRGSACRPEYTTSTEDIFVVENGQRKTVKTRFLYTGYGGLPYSDGNDYPAFVIFTYDDGTQDVKFLTANCQTKDYSEVMSPGKDLLTNVGYGIQIEEGVTAPQVFVHVPQRWMNSMFTNLYVKNADGLKYFKILEDAFYKNTTVNGKVESENIYPTVKIYRINYPSEIPVIKTGAAKIGDAVEVDYVGKFENGTVFDSSASRGPLNFTVGEGQVIQGFEEAVLGMTVNETKTVTIPPEKAYGSASLSPLANKTLVFGIRLLSINKPHAEFPQQSSSNATLNLTFDYYNKTLNDQYGIDKYPTIVWDCQFKRFGTVELELDALKKLTCILSKGTLTDVCAAADVRYNGTKIVARDETYQKYITALIAKVAKVAGEPCAQEGKAKLQVFYSEGCAECAEQKLLLDQFKGEFSDILNITHYCVGNETYCTANSKSTV